MRCARKNYETIYLTAFVRKEEILQNGRRTGTYRKVYGEKRPIKANVRPTTTDVTMFTFGEAVICDYIVLFNVKQMDGIRPEDHVWIRDHEYKIQRIQSTYNVTRLAVKEVELDAGKN